MKLRKFMLAHELVAIMIPFLVVGVILLRIITNSLSEDVHKKNDIIGHTITTYVTDLLYDPLRHMEQMREFRRSGIMNNSQFEQYVATVVLHHDYFESIEIVNSQGAVESVVPTDNAVIKMNRSGHDFFKTLNEEGQTYWSPVFTSPRTGKPTVMVAITMQDKFLVGYLNLENISKIANNFQQLYGTDTLIAITDEQGTYISHNDMNRVSQRRVEDNIQYIKAQTKLSGQSHHLTYDGRDYLVSIEKAQNPAWYILVYQSYDSAFSLSNYLRRILLWIASMAAIGTILVSWLKTTRILNSLSRLNQRVENLSSGNYSDVVASDNFEEFDKLAGRFDQMANNIKERDKALKKLAYFDVVTGLPNKTLLIERLKELMLDSTSKIAIIFMDVDNLKIINDSHGHWVGDKVIGVLADELSPLLKDGDILARFGGDEFVFALIDYENDEYIDLFIRKVIAVLASHKIVEGHSFHLGINLGVARYPEDSKDINELLKCADIAMHNTKALGKNNYQYYNSKMQEELQQKIAIENALHKAIAHREFELFYQPLLKTKGNEIRGFEALIRWNSPELGAVSPLRFIGIAEDTGLIVPIGKWVLETACQKAAEIAKVLNEDFVVAVNVSVVQLRDSGFAESVKSAIVKSGIKPSQLEIEITESVIIDSFVASVSTIEELKAFGVRISLDDFGTGYSSLAYLNMLPIDTLKIDKSFINDIVANHRSRSLLEAVVGLAVNLRLGVVAEGVETKEQLEVLELLECEYCQGYYFKKPMPASEVLAYCESMRRK